MEMSSMKGVQKMENRSKDCVKIIGSSSKDLPSIYSPVQKDFLVFIILMYLL